MTGLCFKNLTWVFESNVAIRTQSTSYINEIFPFSYSSTKPKPKISVGDISKEV